MCGETVKISQGWWEKISQQIVLDSCIFTHQRINLDPYLTPFTKLTQMESDLKLRAKNYKSFRRKRKMKLNFHDLGFESTHLNDTKII